MDNLKFAQMLCSRLCHDLITPIGAINTGLEIIESCNPAERNQLMDLTCQSAQTAERRLVFYRAAFGFSGSAHFAVPDQFTQSLREFLETLKIKVRWTSPLTFQDFDAFDLDPGKWGRVSANLILLAIDAAPYGGDLELAGYQEGAQLIQEIILKGNLVEMRKENIQAVLEEVSEEELTPQAIQAYMTKILADQLQLKIYLKEQTRHSLIWHLTYSRQKVA